MSFKSTARRVVPRFEDFCTALRPEFTGQCLADYVFEWLKFDAGTDHCLLDFQTFLTAWHAIIDEWVRDRIDLSYVNADIAGVEEATFKRSVTSIYGKDGYNHPILDPDFFAECVFKRHHGGSIALPHE